MTEKNLLMKTNEKLVSCSLQTAASGCRITNKLLKHVHPLYFAYMINAAKAPLRPFSREIFKLIPFISELKISRKRRSKAEEKMENFREPGTKCALSVPFLEFGMYTQCLPSVGSTVQFLREIG